jgi:hypothetical protein
LRSGGPKRVLVRAPAALTTTSPLQLIARLLGEVGTPRSIPALERTGFDQLAEDTSGALSSPAK